MEALYEEAAPACTLLAAALGLKKARDPTFSKELPCQQWLLVLVSPSSPLTLSRLI